MTSVLFVNHASILIKNKDRFLLTDPWFQKPAFGSWLPTFPPYCHPVYLAALREKLTILISHGHDDHCDDDLLRIFDKSTRILLANFQSPSVSNRLKRIGFTNLNLVDRTGQQIGPFHVKSYVQPTRSDDDALFSIATESALIVHCNDNWFKFDKDVEAAMREDVARYPKQGVLFLSQTNSASGFPMNYDQFSIEEKVDLLNKKVTGMVDQSLKNAKSVGASGVVPYAGYASVFVNGKPEYERLALFPTPRFLKGSLQIEDSSDILDFYPGDSIDLTTGKITKAFVSSEEYTDEAFKAHSHLFYRTYGLVDACDTFDESDDDEFSPEMLEYFLSNMNEFIIRKSADQSTFSTAMGKTFAVEITDLGISRCVKFGTGLCSPADKPNKKVKCSASLMNRVLRGRILFENLYTGYEGTLERNPPNEYNRDLVMFIVMYSYFYKNRLASKFAGPEK